VGPGLTGAGTSVGSRRGETRSLGDDCQGGVGGGPAVWTPGRCGGTGRGAPGSAAEGLPALELVMLVMGASRLDTPAGVVLRVRGG